MATEPVRSSPLAFRLRWKPGDPGLETADAERALMARAAAFLFAAGGSLALLLVALPHSAELDRAGVLRAAIGALIVAVVVAVVFDRLPKRSFHLILLLGSASVSYGIFFAGKSTTAGPMFYLLPALYVFYFFTWSQALAHMAGIGGGYALALHLDEAVFPLADWLVTLGILAAAGVLVRLLRDRADALLEELGARASESAEQAEALRAGRETLSAQHAVTRVLAESGDLDEAMPGVLRALGRGLAWDWGAYWALDSSGDALHCSFSWLEPGAGLAPFEALARRITLARGEGLPGRVLESGAVALIEDVTVDPNFPRARAARAAGLHGAIALPIRSGAEIVGVMEFLSASPARPDDRLTEVVSAIGSQVGQFIDRTRAEQQVRQHVENIAAVAEATRELSRSVDTNSSRPALCEAARKVSGARLAVLLEPDAKGHSLVATASSEPALEHIRVPFVGETSGAVRAFVSGEPFYVADAPAHPAVSQRLVNQTGTKSILNQPVLREGEPIAVLTVAWDERVARLPERVEAMMRLLAEEAAAAVERSDLLARLEGFARTDELTGLPNRRAWEDELERELARAQRHQRPVCVAMLDLDRFKRYNDDHGHQAGDRLLKQAAGVWRTELRATDFMARYGGEEFCVLLPDCDLEAGVAIVTRLCAGVPGDQTCSAGVACWDASETPEALLGRADASLYAAKRAGRDRVLAAT